MSGVGADGVPIAVGDFVRTGTPTTVQSFYLVWSPTGSFSPSKRHATEEAAQAQATRLAQCSGNAEFFVLRAVSRTHAMKVTTERLS